MVQPYRVFISVKTLITEHAGLRINTFLNRTDVSKSTLNNLEKPRPTSPATVSNVEIAFNAALEERRQPKIRADEMMMAKAHLTDKACKALKALKAEIGLDEMAKRATITNRVLVKWILKGKPAGRSYVDRIAALPDQSRSRKIKCHSLECLISRIESQHIRGCNLLQLRIPTVLF